MARMAHACIKVEREAAKGISRLISFVSSLGKMEWGSASKLCKDWMEDLKDPLFLFLEGVKKDWHIHLWSG